MVNGCTWLKDNLSLEVSILLYKLIFNTSTDTKRCGFYNDGLEHGGPSGGEENQAGLIANEQTLLNNGDANLDVVPTQLELTNPRPNRRRRDTDDQDFKFVDSGNIYHKR